jgi:hypothetical protein
MDFISESISMPIQAKPFFEVLKINFHPIIMKYKVQFIVLSFTFVLTQK